MANGLPINASSVFAGLGTAECIIVTAGMYSVEVQASIPYVASGSPYNSDDAAAYGSALSLVVNLNGAPALTLTAPAPNQPMVAGKVQFSCAAGDSITVVLTSSAAVDAAPNAIKTMINIYQGS